MRAVYKICQSFKKKIMVLFTNCDVNVTLIWFKIKIILSAKCERNKIRQKRGGKWNSYKWENNDYIKLKIEFISKWITKTTTNPVTTLSGKFVKENVNKESKEWANRWFFRIILEGKTKNIYTYIIYL